MEELKKRLEKEQREIRIRKFTKNKASVFGLVVVTVMILLAVLAPLICRYDPLALDVKSRLQGCSADHWFGTDTMGRDVFARVLYGARISLTVGFTVGITAGIAGIIIGLYASTNKVADNILMRICDGLKAIPSTLLAITLMTVLGADIKNVIISLIVVNIPSMARLARGQALVVKEQTYIEAKQEDIQIIKSPVGMPGRAIFSKFIQKVKEGQKQPKTCMCKCIKTCDISKSPYCIIAALYNAFKGNMDNGYAFAGANAFRATKIVSVKETFRSLLDEFNRAINK